MVQKAALVLGLAALAGCAHIKSYSAIKQRPDEPLAGPKVVVFVDTGDATNTFDLGSTRLLFANALKAKGFAVKRFAKEDGSIRYAIELRADYRSHCRDGGSEFAWLDMYVIDLSRNETVMVLQGAGHSEGCYRSKTLFLDEEEGSLFGDLAALLAAAWKQQQHQPRGVRAETGESL